VPSAGGEPGEGQPGSVVWWELRDHTPRLLVPAVVALVPGIAVGLVAGLDNRRLGAGLGFGSSPRSASVRRSAGSLSRAGQDSGPRGGSAEDLGPGSAHASSIAPETTPRIPPPSRASATMWSPGRPDRRAARTSSTPGLLPADLIASATPASLRLYLDDDVGDVRRCCVGGKWAPWTRQSSADVDRQN
jgi:hypothetical protein